MLVEQKSKQTAIDERPKPMSSSILRWFRGHLFTSGINTQPQNAILNDIHYSAKQLDPIDSIKKGDRDRKKKKAKKGKKSKPRK